MAAARDPIAVAGRGDVSELVRLAAPLAAAFAGNQLLSVVDAAVVGRLGATALAAVSLANALFFTVSVIGFGIVLGCDPVIAQAVGAREPMRARRLYWQGVWVAIVASLVLMPVLLLSPLLLRFFDLPPAAVGQATIYLRARSLGMPGMLMFVASRSYLQAIGITRPILSSIVAANLCNLGVVTVLTYGAGPIPALGMLGAGVATVIANGVQVAWLAGAIALLPIEGWHAEMRRPIRSEMRVIARTGTPVGLHFAAEVGVFSLASVLAGAFGEIALAAHQIALQLASLTFCVAIGFGSAGSVLVGRAIGARDAAGTRRAGLLAFKVGAGVMAGGAVAFLLIPGALAGVITRETSVIAQAVPILAVAAAFQLSDGVQGIGAGVLRGAGDTRFTFVANLIGHYAIGLPLALLLAFRMHGGVVGLWWGLSVGLTTVAIAVLWRWRRLSLRPIAPLMERSNQG